MSSGSTITLGCRPASSGACIQCVAARRPLRVPAAASKKLPTHTEQIRLQVGAVFPSHWIRSDERRTSAWKVWQNPDQRKVLVQLTVSEVLTKESRDAGSAPFVDFQIMIRDAIEQLVFRNDVPVELISKSLAALVEATIDLTVSNRSKAKQYRDSGFQMFCAGITKRQVTTSHK
jgi:hypothetical protein